MTIQTPRERDGVTFAYCTTYEDEQAFLSELKSASSRITVTQVGSSVEGRAVNVVAIGYPTAPAFTESARSGVWVGSQHANEWDGRETLLQFARDLVETTDPTLTGYLAEHPAFFVTNPNPDMVGNTGSGSGDPMNVDGVNLNRDHIQLTAPETQAIANVIATVQPQIVHDMHQGGVEDVDVFPCSHPAIDPTLRDLATEAYTAIRDHLTAQTIGNALYPGHVYKPNTLENSSGLRYAVGILTETYGGNIIEDRITYSIQAIRGFMDWHAANTDRIASTQAKARMWAIGLADRSEPYTVGEYHTAYEAEGTMTIAPPPTAYWLTDTEHAALAAHLDSFGIEATVDGEGYRIDMAQEAGPVVPLLVDGDSTQALVTATRIGRRYEGEPVAYGDYRTEGTYCPTVRVVAQLSGQHHTIWP